MTKVPLLPLSRVPNSRQVLLLYVRLLLWFIHLIVTFLSQQTQTIWITFIQRQMFCVYWDATIPSGKLI